MNNDELLRMRRDKDTFFRQHPMSPLTPEQQAAFTGLRYYPPNPALDLRVKVEPFATQETVHVETSTGDLREMLRYGEFTFEVSGTAAKLTIFEAQHGFFLPFADANANIETYGAGRYLEPELLEDGRFHIDFNQAYNPYCAYGEGWSCPLTPFENRLKVAIEAGEMLPDDAWLKPA